MEWLASIDHETVKHLFGEVFASQVVQYGAAFSVAALIHSARVKKEIRNNFSGLTAAIQSLGQALRDDMKAMDARVRALEEERKATKQGSIGGPDA